MSPTYLKLKIILIYHALAHRLDCVTEVRMGNTLFIYYNQFITTIVIFPPAFIKEFQNINLASANIGGSFFHGKETI